MDIDRNKDESDTVRDMKRKGQKEYRVLNNRENPDVQRRITHKDENMKIKKWNEDIELKHQCVTRT